MQKIMFDDHFGLTQAVMEGKKTMTRRVFGNFAPIVSDVRLNERGYTEARLGDVWFPAGKKKNPKYKVGEVVAVAQRYCDIKEYNPEYYEDIMLSYGAICEASHPYSQLMKSAGWGNKMFVRADLMPHQIRITSVRIERIQDISEDDCLREGIIDGKVEPKLYGFKNGKHYDTAHTPREAFAVLIKKMAGKKAWDDNPWVFVYEFELVK